MAPRGSNEPMASGKATYSALSIDTPDGDGGHRGTPTLASPSLVSRLTPRSSRGRTLVFVGVSCFMGCMLLVAGLYTWGRPSKPANYQKPGYIEPKSISVILTADPGDMIGLSERSIIQEVITDLVMDPDKDHLLCAESLRGRLYGEPVLLVTTGIGHDRAALCLSGILDYYGPYVKEIMFIGTGGFSPAVGGILDSDDCDQPAPADGIEIALLGDMCVSPFATNWDCQKCVWPDEVDSACAKAPCSAHERWDLFGDFACTYFTSTELADEFIAVSKGLNVKGDHDELADRMRSFWGKMSNGTGEDYLSHIDLPKSGGMGSPKVWDYTQCAEATSNTFWVGNPYDELARGYVAYTINDAFSHDMGRAAKQNPGHAEFPRLELESNLTKRDALGISAMEGTGWMSVLTMGEKYLDYKHIPSVNIRGAADYVMAPVARREDGTWAEVEWQTAHDYELGYRYAIETTSAIILNLFQKRRDRKGH